MTETDSATKILTFTLNLDKAPIKDLVISYAVDSTSTASLGDDFTVTAGTVTFVAGQTTAEVQVNVLADDIDEANETIVLSLTNNETVQSGFSTVKRVNDLKATGTIVDDDASFVFTSSAANTVAENTTAVVAVAGADADSAAGLTTTLTGPDAALFTLTNGALAFKAAPNFEAPADAGKDNVYNVSINVVDASGNATTQNLVITVADANEAPTAVALTGQVASIAENTATTARTKVADIVVTDDALGTETFTVGGADAANFEIDAGALYLKAGTALNFEAKSGYSVTVNAIDAAVTGSTDVSTSYTLAVTNVNEAPVAVADVASVITGNAVTLNVLANDTDVDAGTTLAISGTPTASIGTVAVSGGQLVYTAPVGYQGSATISYSITDGAIVVPATATVAVGEPALTAAAASVDEGQSVLFNIKGVANTAYSVQIDSTNLNDVADAIVSVITNASGDAALTYVTTQDRTTEGAQSVRANIVGMQAAPVSVSVVDTSLDNVAPVATSATLAIDEGAPAVTGQLVATDADAADVANLTFSTASVVPGFTLNANGSYSFDATNAAYNSLAAGASSVQTVSFTVNDNATTATGGAKTATGTLTITVTGTNDAPTMTVAGGNVQTVVEGNTAVTSFATADADTGATLSAVTLTGEDAALFQIVGNNLAFRTSTDYEQPTDVNRDGIYNVTLNVTDNNGATATQAVQVTVSDVVEPIAYSLSAGIDTVPGGLGDDTITGLVSASLSALDDINGGAGNDTLTVTDTANINVPASVSVQNVETAVLKSAGTILLDASTWTGLTSLTTTGFGTAAVTAPTTATMALNSTLAASNITANGGSNVSITATGVTTGAITVGATTAPTGTITINDTITGANAAGVINVTGGTSVVINQTSSNAGATHAAVTVTGGASTTSVSSVATATVAGATNNTFAVTDVNSGAASKASTIANVTVGGYTTATINSNALTTLSLANGSGNVIIDNQAATVANTTLNLTVNNLTGGTLDDADIFDTLNVTTTGAASTVANITYGALKTLTVAGDKVLTLTSTAGATALATVTVTGAAGLSATVSQATVTAVDTTGTSGTSTITLDATKATFAGGAGKDNVTTSAAAPTKTIDLGAGDDSLTLASGTTAVTGAITGGAGTDTLSMVAADAVTASGTATFATKVTGFESLTLTGATGAQAVDLAALGGYSKVTSTASAGTLTLNNLASGGTLTITADTAGTGYVANVTNAASNTNDVLNLVLTKAGLLAAGSVTAANVETVNITTADTQTTPTNPLDTLTLAATSATNVTVAGNAGLNLTGVTNLALTSLDASGISAGSFTFTSGALTGAAAIKGSATGTNTVTFSAAVNGAVTYTGGTGADIITASNGKNNVIDLGNGTNSVTGTTGNMTITGGTGADTVTLTTGNNVVNLGNGANAFTATTGNNTYVGGTGVDTITVGGGLNTITTGGGADVVTITTAGANVNVYSTITDPHAGMQIAFTNLGTETFVSSKVTLAGTAVFQDYANAVVAGATQADHSMDGAFGWFQFGGNTYLVQVKHDTTGGIDQSFVNGVDQIVALTGLVDLSTATGGTTNILTLV